MANEQHDPLAGRTDRPDYVPDADIRHPTRADKRREGAFGIFLIAILPVLILAGGLGVWWGVLGERGEPGVTVDIVPHMQPEAVAD
jgi:hypothetical protein